MEFLLRAVIIVVVGYGLLVGCAWGFQRALLYHPDRNEPAPAIAAVSGLQAVRLLTEDGLDLLSWYAPAPAGRATIVLFHGNAGNISHRADKARLFIAAGYGMLLVEYRGYGGNPGDPTEAGLYRDGRAALTFLGGEGVDTASIVLYGESLGSGVAVELARETAVRALVLEAPYTSIPDVGARHYPFLPVRTLARDRFENLAKIAAVEAPILVVHGARDNVVPFDLGRRLFDAAPEPKQSLFLADAGHNDLYGYGAGQSIVEWLDGL
jgi:hypothetical protein